VNTSTAELNEGKSILLVDDEPLVGRSIHCLLELDGHRIDSFTSAPEALDHYQPGRYDVVITDYRMPAMTGLELATALKQRCPQQRIILLTGCPPAKLLPIFDGVVLKPFTRASLLEAIAAPAPKASTALAALVATNVRMASLETGCEPQVAFR
jgi:CheY-like chemotaxis protein